jgi:hypothetical protein
MFNEKKNDYGFAFKNRQALYEKEVLIKVYHNPIIY